VLYGTDIDSLITVDITNSRESKLAGLEYGKTYHIEVYPLDYGGQRVSATPAKLTFSTAFDQRVITDKADVSIDEVAIDYISLSWGSVVNADSYTVCRSENSGEYECLETLVDTSYVDRINLLAGVKYKYAVKASNGNGFTVSDETEAIQIVSNGTILPKINKFEVINPDTCFVTNSCKLHIKITKGDNYLDGGYILDYSSKDSNFSCASYRRQSLGGFGSENIESLDETVSNFEKRNCHTRATLNVCDIEGLCTEKTINLPTTANDTDGDGKYDIEDLDDDNDGIVDTDEIKYGLEQLDERDADYDR